MKDISKELYELSEAIAKKTKESHCGEMFGYGQNFENEIFMMHPFCWCEQDDCGWCAGIGAMPQLLREIGNVKYNESERLPNFHFKPSNFKVWWYKYIGRGMEQSGNLPKDWFKQCIESLK